MNRKIILVPLIALMVISVGLLSGCFSEEIKSTDLSTEEIKNQAIDVNYNDFVRNIEDYKGEIVYFFGRVYSSRENSDGSYDLLIHTGGISYFYDDDIWVNHKGIRILENDYVDVWGYVKGLKSYRTVLGAERTLPELDSYHLEIIE